jgi:hypothetical protein
VGKPQIKRMRTALVSVLLASSLATTAVAQTAEPSARSLGDHIFLFPRLQESAFVTSDLGTALSLSRNGVPALSIGQLGTADVVEFGFNTNVEFGVAFTDWLGINGTLAIAELVGISGGSALASGAAYNLSGDGTAVFRLWRGPTTQFSLRAGGGYSKGQGLTLIPLVTQLVDTPLRTLRDVRQGNFTSLITVPRRSSSLEGGLYLAQSLGPLFSLQLSLAPRFTWNFQSPYSVTAGERVEEEGHSFEITGAAALDWDFARWGVPVAVLGEYSYTIQNRSGFSLPNDVIHTEGVSAGVYYSGRANLQTGLVWVGVYRGEPSVGVAVGGQPAYSGLTSAQEGLLVLRYIW